jgi:hypothetical protein
LLLRCHRLISYIYPSRNQELVEKLQAKKATVIGEGRSTGDAALLKLVYVYPYTCPSPQAGLSACAGWARQRTVQCQQLKMFCCVQQLALCTGGDVGGSDGFCMA